MSLRTNLSLLRPWHSMDSCNRHLKPLRILLIEQHSGVRQALATRLRSSPLVEVVSPISIEKFTAPNLDAPSCDVVLLGLPCVVVGGFTVVVEKVTEMVQAGKTVIVLSSYADDGEREALMAAGISRYLLKNINTPKLLDEIITTIQAS